MKNDLILIREVLLHINTALKLKYLQPLTCKTVPNYFKTVEHQWRSQDYLVGEANINRSTFIKPKYNICLMILLNLESNSFNYPEISIIHSKTCRYRIKLMLGQGRGKRATVRGWFGAGGLGPPEKISILECQISII